MTDEQAVLVLNDLPASALCGIDLLSFTTSSRFRGVKQIPPGFHFVFIATTSTFSERHGLWFHVPASTVQGQTVIIARWDATSETLVAETDSAVISQQKSTVNLLWEKHLTPYRQTAADDHDNRDWNQDSIDEWSRLTSFLTPSLLSRILGDTPDQWTLSSSSSASRDLENIPGLDTSPSVQSLLQTEKLLTFLPIELRQTWRPGATGRERTIGARDFSWALEHLISTCCTDSSAEEILGELQFCFVMILTLNNYSCVEQWRRILSLSLTCQSVVQTRAEFFTTLTLLLRRQFEHAGRAEDAGLIDLSGESGATSIQNLVARFRKGIESLQGVDIQSVVDAVDDLEEYMQAEHGWQNKDGLLRGGILELEDGEEVRPSLGERGIRHGEEEEDDEDDETGEYAPQIVDLTPEQARMLAADDEDRDHMDIETLAPKPLVTRLRYSKSKNDDDGIDTSDDSEKEHDDDDEISVQQEEEELQDLDQMDARY